MAYILEGIIAMNSATKLSLAAVVIATVAGSLLAASAADAGFPSYLKARLPYYAAYDPLWKLKNPGGPVELNPQPLPPGIYKNGFGLSNPGFISGFNPQPDPPGFQ